jgi:two-component system chemotaxis response regulator CheB
MGKRRIRVLVVEDLLVVRKFLVRALNADPEIEVIGAVTDGQQAIDFVAQERPDVITMDIQMPRLDGFEATRRIMASHPVPIIIVSGSFASGEVVKTFRAMEVGAVAIVARPSGIGSPDEDASAAEFARTVKLMAGVKVVGRRAGVAPREPARDELARAPEVRLIAIGASTGGPQALRLVLSALGPSLAVPVLVVQHIAAGFSAGFAEWLADASGLPVSMAGDGDRPAAGRVYVGPDHHHLGVREDGRLLLSDAPPVFGLRPAVDFLFRSVAQVYGPRAAGVLLSGMGQDGAAALGELRAAGAVTYAQDEASCVVFGMPGAAVNLGAATHVLAPEAIGKHLALLSAQRGRVSS